MSQESVKGGLKLDVLLDEAKKKIDDLTKIVDEQVKKVEQVTKEHPSTTLTLAFVAGAAVVGLIAFVLSKKKE